MRTKLGHVTVHANIEETQSCITNKENYKRTNWKQFEKNEYQELFYHKWDLDMTNTGPWLGLFLTHWGRATHICVAKLTTIGSDNGLSPGRRQAIIWTIAGILLIGPLGTNFSEILIGIQTFSFKKMHLKISSAKWRPSCLGLNVLITNEYHQGNNFRFQIHPRVCHYLI